MEGFFVNTPWKIGVEEELSLVICGAAGQGIQTVESLLVRLFKRAGFYVYASKEYMSRVRGGSNSTEIRVSTHPVSAFVERIDLLFVLNKGVRPHILNRLSRKTAVIADKEEVGSEFDAVPVPFFDLSLQKTAREAGGTIYEGTVAVGVIARLFNLSESLVKEEIGRQFEGKREEVIKRNIEATQKGAQLADLLMEKGLLVLPKLIPQGEGPQTHIVLNGTDALCMGALAGGCDFVSAYPMSPATGVLTLMSHLASRFKIVTEQAEDEIAAINMAIGAWYAGGRGLVTTSGGGFDLMTEALSLSGISETPIVIHLGQRPGPATGMATRTEQADLNIALYGGHGEFPRALFAPGSLEEAYLLTAHAFNLSAKYQIPVIILTDQYFLDTFVTVPRATFKKIEARKEIVETKPDYLRYQNFPDGISPRGIPGYGKGFVCVDSHEHNEAGRIREDFSLRVRMNDKRLKKLEGLTREAIKPTFKGPQTYRNLVVGWGSTAPIIDEALSSMGRTDTSHLHFGQVYPIASDAKTFFLRAAKIVCVEGNATGQFGKLLRTELGIEEIVPVLRYDGLPMSVEWLAKKLSELL